MEPAVVVRIHPGQFMNSLLRGLNGLRYAFLALGPILLLPLALGGHQLPPDSLRLHQRARRAQRDFEAVHRESLPRGKVRFGEPCDEYVGPLCLSDNDRGWEPAAEDLSIVAARERLLESLAEVGRASPGDRWVLGQRVRYLGDSGRWREAETLARGCRSEEGWWCLGLLGYVLHRSGRVVEALEAFSQMRDRMDPEEAGDWTDPSPLLDRPEGRWVEAPRGLTPAEAESKFWTLADPLYLTPGNERLSEHFARRFASFLFEDSALTIGLSWGRASEEVLLRYGFVAGWERSPGTADEVGRAGVVEHWHPEGRGLLPPLEALEDTPALPEGVWTPQDGRPRSSSAPILAPLIAEGRAQTAVLRRGGALLVLAAYGIPGDSLLQRRRPPESLPSGGATAPGEAAVSRRPLWEPSADGYSGDTLAGLFLVADTGKHALLAAFGSGGEGVLQLSAPLGGYLLSVEQWSPSEKWGARVRHGIRADSIPPDVPHLSDLLLLTGQGDPPASLPEALPLIRPTTEIPAADRVTVAWEVYGLGTEGGPITFGLSLGEEEGGFLRRALRRIGLFRGPPTLTLSWQEENPGRPGPLFRSTELDLPPLRPGRYRLRLEMALPFRNVVVSSRWITVS